MYFGVAFLFIGARKLATTQFANEWLLSSVCANVRGEVVGPGKGSHADSALKRLLTSVDADVSSELVRAREPTIARCDWTRVLSLVDRGLARTVGILAGLDWNQFDWSELVLFDRMLVLLMVGNLIRVHLLSLRVAVMMNGRVRRKMLLRLMMNLMMLLLRVAMMVMIEIMQQLIVFFTSRSCKGRMDGCLV